MNHSKNNNCRLSYGIICIKNKNVADAASSVSSPSMSPRFRIFEKLQNRIPLTADEMANFDILMIRGKHSYNYIEFIMGKYDISNVEYIISLLSEITENERILLSGTAFELLWKNLWNISPNDDISAYINEYDNAKAKYEQLVAGFSTQFNKKMIQIDLRALLDICRIPLQEPVWGFPKGKRNTRGESELDCALREFHEETNIPSNHITILPIHPIQEYYKASNKKFYCNIYYIAEYIGNLEDELTIIDNNIHQMQEIGDIQWIPWNNAYRQIHANYPFRKNILYQLELLFRNIC